MFSIGGSTGIILSTNVMNIALHDSYYVVSHFHLVLSLGAINSIFSGISTLHEHLLTTISISNNTLMNTSILSNQSITYFYAG
jgi:heme/copper-type cytochrome/quinol oxidase subunit 1